MTPEERNKILDEAIEAVCGIPDPYPLSIFTPLPGGVYPKLKTWCESEGFVIDQLSADYARWQRGVVISEVRDAISNLKGDE